MTSSQHGGSAAPEPGRSAIGGRTPVYGVFGHPVGHSLSPAMQNAALAHLGLDGIYVAFDVPPDALGDAVRAIRALGLAGVNCTIPHKEAVIPLLDELTEDAARIGAVNTIENRSGLLVGHNTDAGGFLAALRAEGLDPGGLRSVVLGAGGSARAVAAGLAMVGGEVALANRTVERSQALAEELNRKLGRQAIRAVPDLPGALRAELAGADLLVNTTPVGMGREGEMRSPAPGEALHAGLFVYDLIYNPLETRLLREARACGARAAGGAGMLAHQGALALEIWTGAAAPVDLMRRVILERLALAGGARAPGT